MLSFTVNNDERLYLTQEAHDGPVVIAAPNSQTIVPAGDMVQLCNLYRYVKRYDINDAFINPRGRFVPGSITQPAPAPDPEREPLRFWFFLCQDGEGGYHILRKPIPSGADPTAEQLKLADLYREKGGTLVAAWPAGQVVEIADLADIPLDAPADPAQQPSSPAPSPDPSGNQPGLLS